jgi:hypothetical protein
MKSYILLFTAFWFSFSVNASNHSTTNFTYEGHSVDISVLEELGDTLENNFERITKSLTLTIKDKIEVHVYADLSSYHNAIGKPGSPDWMVGSAYGNVIRMVSPENPGSYHSKASLLKVIVHEFTHVCVNTLNSQVPIWLNEANAVYYARQILSPTYARQLYNENNEKIPTIGALAGNFEGNHGYQWAYTIVDYIISTYSGDSLRAFILKPSQWSILGASSQTDFDAKWHTFVMKKYIDVKKYNVTLKVDMNQYSQTFNGVSVYGNFNGWNRDNDKLSDDDNDGIYEITLALEAGYTLNWKYYILGPNHGEIFNENSTCVEKKSGYFNRELLVESDYTSPAYCFNTCDVCEQEPEKFNVTLKVDMSDYNQSFNGVSAYGTFNEWNRESHKLSDADKDGIYEITIQLSKGFNLAWKYYVLGPNHGEGFNASSSCVEKESGYYNRFIKVESDYTTPAYCFNSCEACKSSPEKYEVTFKVDMRNYDQNFNKVHLNGTFNNWCGPCNEMLDENRDGVYELTLAFDKNAYIEYKFTVDGWTNDEKLQKGLPCTKTWDPYTNRFLNVTQDLDLDVVCWESCEPCITVGLNEFKPVLTIYPNPTSGILNIDLVSDAETVISITSTNGKEVYRRTVEQSGLTHLEVNNLPSGTYIVQLLNNKMNLNKKLIVN